MNKQRTAALLSATTICLLSAMPGHAAFVTYSASGTIDQVDHTSPFPAVFSSAAVGQTLSVQFTFDTSAAGSVNAPGDVSYFGSLVSETASIGSAKLGLALDFNQIEISNNAAQGASYFTGFQLSSSTNAPANFTGITSDFALNTTANGASPLSLYQDTSLNNSPLHSSDAKAEDDMALVFTSYVNGGYQSSGDIFVSKNISIAKVDAVAAPEINPASAGGAMMLLFGSLAVLRGRKES